MNTLKSLFCNSCHQHFRIKNLLIHSGILATGYCFLWLHTAPAKRWNDHHCKVETSTRVALRLSLTI